MFGSGFLLIEFGLGFLLVGFSLGFLFVELRLGFLLLGFVLLPGVIWGFVSPCDGHS